MKLGHQLSDHNRWAVWLAKIFKTTCRLSIAPAFLIYLASRRFSTGEGPVGAFSVIVKSSRTFVFNSNLRTDGLMAAYSPVDCRCSNQTPVTRPSRLYQVHWVEQRDCCYIYSTQTDQQDVSTFSFIIYTKYTLWNKLTCVTLTPCIFWVWGIENCDSFKPNKKMHHPLYLTFTDMIIDDYKQKRHKHPVFDVIQLKPLRCTIKSQRRSWPESECPSVRSLCHIHSKPGHSFRLPDTGTLLQFRALQLWHQYFNEFLSWYITSILP